MKIPLAGPGCGWVGWWEVCVNYAYNLAANLKSFKSPGTLVIGNILQVLPVGVVSLHHWMTHGPVFNFTCKEKNIYLKNSEFESHIKDRGQYHFNIKPVLEWHQLQFPMNSH